MSNFKIYRASAGSGKTYTLALEYIKELLKSPDPHAYRHILAVTFTKDATSEMKARILSDLYGLAFACRDTEGFLSSLCLLLAEGKTPLDTEEIRKRALSALENMLHDYSRVYITTIDSFFQKVLHHLVRELGKSSGFDIEMDTDKVLEEAVDRVIENSVKDEQLLNWLIRYVEDRMNRGISWHIEKEIFTFSKCIFDERFQEHKDLLERELSGDNSVLSRLYARHQGVQAKCKAFFKKEQQELERLLESRSLSADDFVRKGLPIRWIANLSAENFGNALKSSASQTFAACREDPEAWTAKKHPRREEIRELAASSLIPILNEEWEVLQEYLTSRMITGNIHQLGLIYHITSEIEARNREYNRFMLADTALFLNRMIDDSDAPFIYEKVGADIRHVMVDEFQDTSRLQWKNLKVLLKEILSYDRFSMIVGDVKQSIYRWRNGDWNILNGIDRELGIRSLVLPNNYRSEKTVVEFNNDFFMAASGLLDTKYRSVFGEDGTESPFQTAYSRETLVQTPFRKNSGGYVSVDFVSAETAEEGSSYGDEMLESVFEKVELLSSKGIPADKICILTRTNKSLAEIADYFSSKAEKYPDLYAGNYLRIVSDDAFQLGASSALCILMNAVCLLYDPGDLLAREQMRVLLKDCLGEEAPEFDPSAEELSFLPLLEFFGYVYRKFHLEKIPGQSAYMFAFYDAVEEYMKSESGGLSDFIRFWKEELSLRTVSSGGGIPGLRAMTIHKSKGLEFHTVLVPFCDWTLSPEKNPIVWCGKKEGSYELDLLPVRYSENMKDSIFREEYERETSQSWVDHLNLLYVAFTRACSNLFVLAKSKKKTENAESTATVSDLLQLFMKAPAAEGYDEERQHYERGALAFFEAPKAEETDNRFRQAPAPLPARFFSKAFGEGEEIFRQSNQSMDYLDTEGNVYIEEGNVMHKLFSYIKTLADIPEAVERMIYEGILQAGEKESYVERIREAIRLSGTETWFSGDWKILNEHSILVKEGEEVLSKRPDRVMLSEGQAVVVDYKFGQEKPSHRKQMQSYLSLLEKMGYQNRCGYLWYVNEHRYERI